MLPADVTPLSVYPHAHYLGKEMRVEATLPDSRTMRLPHIRRWDFHWQQDYRYVTPVALPRGTRITMRYTYDNSEENAANPSRPPRPVTWGPQSSDEMGNLGLQLLAAPAIGRCSRGRSPSVRSATTFVAPRSGSGTRRTIPAERTWLGSSYLEVGRIADAIVEIAVRSGPMPRKPGTFSAAYLSAGRTKDAVAELQAAVSSPRATRTCSSIWARPSPLPPTRRPPPIASSGRSRSIPASAAAPGAGRSASVTAASPRPSRIFSAVELAPDSATAHSDLGGERSPRPGGSTKPRRTRRALELISPTCRRENSRSCRGARAASQLPRAVAVARIVKPQERD